MRILSTIKVKLHHLKVNLFVRKELDTERVWFLSELIEAGQPMNENMKVTSDFNIIDGRHRYEAYDLNKVEEVVVDIVEIRDEVEAISEAYMANVGGSKPPTSGDTEHTIELLLERKQTIKSISERIALPTSITRQFVNDIKSRVARKKLQDAISAVVDGGLTASKAAEQYGVDVEKLKEALSGTRKKHKQSKHGVDELQRAITFTYKSVGSKNGSSLRKVLEKYEDGDVTAIQVSEIIEHIESCQKKSARSIADWKKRFEVKVSERNGNAFESVA